jgi:hypothetical protein
MLIGECPIMYADITHQIKKTCTKLIQPKNSYNDFLINKEYAILKNKILKIGFVTISFIQRQNQDYHIFQFKYDYEIRLLIDFPCFPRFTELSQEIPYTSSRGYDFDTFQDFCDNNISTIKSMYSKIKLCKSMITELMHEKDQLMKETISLSKKFEEAKIEESKFKTEAQKLLCEKVVNKLFQIKKHNELRRKRFVQSFVKFYRNIRLNKNILEILPLKENEDPLPIKSRQAKKNLAKNLKLLPVNNFLLKCDLEDKLKVDTLYENTWFGFTRNPMLKKFVMSYGYKNLYYLKFSDLNSVNDIRAVKLCLKDLDNILKTFHSMLFCRLILNATTGYKEFVTDQLNLTFAQQLQCLSIYEHYKLDTIYSYYNVLKRINWQRKNYLLLSKLAPHLEIVLVASKHLYEGTRIPIPKEHETWIL